jgi:NAD-dependent dihydropyrimidine dehydrogenase PreA subunit
MGIVTLALVGACVEAIGEPIMAAVVKFEMCEGCGACVDMCPSGAIALKDDKAVVDTELCADCGACVDTCPTQAIEMH